MIKKRLILGYRGSANFFDDHFSMQTNEKTTNVLKLVIYILRIYFSYFLDELLPIGTHVVDSVPVHREVRLESFVLLQQTL